MSTEPNVNRPTPTWRLVLFGLLAGSALAWYIFATSGTDPDSATDTATAIGSWAIRGLLLVVVIAGGWSAIRRGRS